jgi:hypothetical protein
MRTGLLVKSKTENAEGFFKILIATKFDKTIAVMCGDIEGARKNLKHSFQGTGVVVVVLQNYQLHLGAGTSRVISYW